MLKKSLVSSLALGLVLAGSIGVANAQTIAGGNVTPGSNALHADGNYGSTISIEAEATSLNMTVPSAMGMIFKADGTNAVPNNFVIANDSAIGGIHLTSVTLDSKNGWSLAGADYNFATQRVNENVARIKVGAKGQEVVVEPNNKNDSGTDATGGKVTFAEGDFDIASKGNNTLSFIVERGTFNKVVSTVEAFDMTMNFAFDTE